MKNAAQITGVLRILITAFPFISAYLAVHGINSDDLTIWIGTGITFAMAIWSGFANTQANQAISTSKIEGVKVIVTPEAPESVQEAARNKSSDTKDVVMLADLPLPKPDSKPPGRKSSPR